MCLTHKVQFYERLSECGEEKGLYFELLIKIYRACPLNSWVLDFLHLGTNSRSTAGVTEK